MLPTEQQAPRFDWGVWIQWITACTAGYAAGASLVYFVAGSLNASSILFVCVGGAIAGVLLGALQCLVLRKQLVGLGWWVLATGAGSALGSPLGTITRNAISAFTSDIIGATIGSAVIGLVFGLLQWLVLRRQFSGSSRWIWASMAGNALATLAGAIVSMDGIVLFAVTGAVFGAITGVVLVRLVQQPRPSSIPQAI